MDFVREAIALRSDWEEPIRTEPRKAAAQNKKLQYSILNPSSPLPCDEHMACQTPKTGQKMTTAVFNGDAGITETDDRRLPEPC